MRSIRKVVVLGANGAMGSGSGAVFAAAGIPTVFLARTLEKAEAGRARADQLTKGAIAPNLITCGTYGQDLASALADADLVLEAVSEDLAVKRDMFVQIDALLAPNTIASSTNVERAALPEGGQRLIASSTNVERAALPEGGQRLIASSTNVERAALPEGGRRLIASSTNVERAALPEGGRRLIVATVSSGLSIGEMCADRSAAFRASFLGVHLFNPPTIIRGCELIPHAGTDPGVVAVVRDFLTNVCDREVVECADTPAFAGNRLGFKVLNEVAQLAEEHGVAFMDQLVGPHTGRALPPLATIDLVGWDVHKAIVDNLYARTHDTCRHSFVLPAYMQRMIDRGHLGRKTRDKGGFFRMEGKGPTAKHFVLEPATGEYKLLSEVAPPIPAFVEKMKAAIRDGRHAGAMEVLCTAEGREADLLRKVLLGYISYGLGLVGEVVQRPRDIDRIMGFGFNWAPPSVLVDAIGPARTVKMLESAKLPVPMPILEAASHGRAMFNEPSVDSGRFFIVAA